MPCADGELCKLPDVALGPTEGHDCRGGCGGRMHGICGEVEDPDGGNEIYRICHSCATKKKAQTSPPLSNPPKRKEVEGGFPAPGTRKKSTPAAAARGARTRLNFGQKLEVLKLLDQKVAQPEIARRFNCGTTAIGTIRKSRVTLLADAAASSRSASSKSSKGGDFPKIDRYTMELVETARAEGLPVVRSTIQTFGAKARDAVVAKAQTDEDREKYEGFTASINWAKNFVVRNNLSETRPHGIGDGGSVDATLGRQDPPQEVGARNGTDEGGPGDGGHPAPDEGDTMDGDHPAPEGEEEEEQKNAFDEGDSNQPVADHADGSTSRPDVDTKKAERGAGRGAKKAPVPPPYADVADYFGRLEATAGECAMERVSHFLCLAKMEWIDEYEKRKGRQTDIRDFFSSK